jgi:hypothetical protein
VIENTCIPSYFGDRGVMIANLRLARATLARPYLKNKNTNKGLGEGRVAQVAECPPSAHRLWAQSPIWQKKKGREVVL